MQASRVTEADTAGRDTKVEVVMCRIEDKFVVYMHAVAMDGALV